MARALKRFSLPWLAALATSFSCDSQPAPVLTAAAGFSTAVLAFEVDDRGLPNPLVRISSGTGIGDSLMLVADAGSRQIYALSSTNGRLIVSLGREGRGPGEFRDITWIAAVSADTIAAYDRRNHRITLFNSQFDLAGTIDIASITRDYIQPECMTADGSIIATQPAGPSTPPEEGLYRQRSELRQYAPDRSAVTTLAMIDHNPQWVTASTNGRTRAVRLYGVPFTVNPVIRCQGMQVLWTDGFVVHIFDLGSGASRVVPIEKASRAVLPRDRARFADSIETVLGLEARDALEAAMKEVPVDSMPLYRDMIVDEGGAVWLLGYESANDTTLWYGHSRDGRLLDQLAVPAAVRVQHISPSWLLGIFVDSLDVPRVRLYAR